MRENLQEQLLRLPDYLGNHLLISVIALAVGIGISLPLAIYISKRSRLRGVVLTVAGVIQTIPSLALLALMVPAFVFLNRADWLDIPALGFYPAVTALTLYSMLPILRNTVTGISGVDPALTEAARGLGMTPRQQLLRVELPLAAPVIIAGVRTATVWVIGIATLSTPVGQTSLGNYIFSGLQTQNWTAVVLGCISAAVLAVVLDSLIGLLERAVAERKRRLMVGSMVAVLVVIAGGLTPMYAQRARRAAASDQTPMVVGAKSFTEQYILSETMQGLLNNAGLRARKLDSLGSTVVFDALVAGRVDAYVDYSGTIWANHMKRKDTPDSETVLREMTSWLDQRYGIQALGALGFENAYALAMRRDRAETLGIRTVGDLAGHAPDMAIGGDYEFFSRPEWASLREAYGLRFRKRVSLDSTFMYQAVYNREVDVISAFSSDGRIAAFDLVVLEDPRNAFPPYDAVLLLSRSGAGKPELVEALRPMVGGIPVDVMRQANQMVDVENRTVGQAGAWLREQLTLAPSGPDAP